MPQQIVSWRASAKINLALHVTARRPDGYHLIESLVVFTRFGDLLQATLAETDGIVVSGRYASTLPVDDHENLITRARDALRAPYARQRPQPVLLSLEKNLPVASGIGGGSSDAAATLRALSQLWNLPVTEAELARIGLTLGADLPMCLAAQPLVARGIGDELTVVGNFPALGLVLVNPGVAVSTGEVFANLTSRENGALPELPRVFDFHSLRNWLETTRNDLEPAARAIQPAIGTALAALDRAGSGFSRMSGSGATCFGLFETGNVAKRAAAAIRARHPDWFVAATRSLASEDEVHGQD